ncbi:hypothetical protein TPHA_0A01210 [Tetrapisispora phaffii CBS 4417]|uniref:Nuclear protein localization protein 4 n=1 Tax=Tetrapisispora phaffii (strain ATCC 24235 / CBS 4417 / NBRC 1672 / NRRL Y-8282 / UCD 70-5) TaxID=1071381 RepID=G8BMS7_TETPH|nr:hypothetical protein TPHA_0A01210 [Tetrapisispora phaffii CBS 4417]CCE61205.1 hypothetical protein TPHA_0A01210 [Tetrapisispora phaffii CBS 4417]
MLLRFRSRNGMERVSCESGDSFGKVLSTLAEKHFGTIDLSSITVGNDPKSVNEPASNIAEKSIDDLGLKHGDIVYIEYKDVISGGNSVSVDGVPNSQAIWHSVAINTSGVTMSQPMKVQESPLDENLERQSGFIARTKSSLCKHGDKGMCEYCSPLPPWDREYHKEHGIKHVSFHSYLKQLDETTNKKSSGSSYIAPLSQPNYKIDKRCTNGHEPWPRGICSKCQPSAITLKQQEFRMVDHVEFQKSDLINEFINSWRTTGTQRFGYMYGKYEPYDVTPLGIKAVVEAIYEPSQHDEQDGLTMDMEQVSIQMAEIDELSKEMGLSRIGLIFTDLTDTGNGNGTVFCKRHKDSFFLSSLEVINSSKHQLQFPNACKFSEQGHFSSKFVTCVISGNLQNEIDISSYQVSTEAEALVDATMISGSTHPSMAYINETTKERYVPEIFYMKTNEYGLTVKENAKPAFPVDYLLVTLTHGFFKNSEDNEKKGIFTTNTGFPWANRQAMGVSQDYHEMKKYLYTAATGDDFQMLKEKLSNFHLLLYIYSLEILSKEEWSQLLQSIIHKDDNSNENILKLISSPGWQTLVMILQESM